MAPSQAFFLRKRRELGPLCQPLPSWICVNTITLCPGVVDPEGAQSQAIYSTQVLTVHMMLATNHRFKGIQEKAMVFIQLEFRDPQDTRSQWRVASFEYLDGVWEWVQVTSDHIASCYTMLVIQYATKPAGGAPQNCVSIVALPTKCSQTIDLPSAQISNKGGATTRSKGLVSHVKVDPRSADPPSPWKDWNEYLQDKPGELTPGQVMGVISQHQQKINRSVARILELNSSTRMLSIIGQVLLDAIRRGKTSTQPESFLQAGPSQLLQDFFDSLPDHQIDI